MSDTMRSRSADEQVTLDQDADEFQLLAHIDRMAAAIGGPIHRGGGLQLEPRGEGAAKNDGRILLRQLAAILDKFTITEPARGELTAMITRFEVL